MPNNVATIPQGAASPALIALASQAQAVGSHQARVVVRANVASLAAFSGVTAGTPVDGVTCVAGDYVLLVGQTTASQNGLYVVGTVAAGTAPLTRPASWATGMVIPEGASVDIGGEGTVGACISWKSFVTTIAKVVDTDDPLFYPRIEKGSHALTSGTPSTFTASSLFVASGGVMGLANATTAANGTKGVLTAGQGTGSLAITGPNTVTDVIHYTVTNF